MRILAVITARGGSKGIPRKNLATLLGKPLLGWTADCVLAARSVTRAVVSTDDEEIAAVARNCGIEAPFLRPAHLAADTTPSVPVVQHAVRWLEESGDCFDAILTVQPTNPLRRPRDIDGAVQLLERTGADSVISFVDVGEKHPARMKFLDEEGRVIDPPFAELFEGMPRQLLPRMFLREGSIYLTRRDVLMQRNSLKGDDCRAWLVPAHRACNIDTPFDLELARFLIAYGARHEEPVDCRV